MHLNLRQIFLDEVARHRSIAAAAKHFNVHANLIERIANNPEANPSLPNAQKALNDYLAKHPPEDFDVGMGKVLVLMPVWKSVEGKTFATITKALADYGRDQIELIPEFSTDVEQARCRLADRAIAAGAKWVIFCDSDAVLPCGYGPYLRTMGYNIPEPNASLNAFARILTAPPEQRILSALCFLRREPLVAACSTGVRGGFSASELVRLRNEPGETGTEPQDWVGMHFTRIEVSVFLEMRERMPELAPKEARASWGYFLKEHAGQSEDGAFCVKCARLGIQSWVDTTLRVGHIIGGVI